MSNKKQTADDNSITNYRVTDAEISKIKQLRKCFPQIKQTIADNPLVYLDNAATTLKPSMVIQAITQHYQNEVANVHRASHTLSNQATLAFEQVRQRMASYINANSSQEIIWTSGATEAINLVAFGFMAEQLQAGDEILISALEHHANIVPWQQLAKNKSLSLKVIPLDKDAKLDMQAFYRLCNKNTKLLAITGLSNATGYAPPLEKMLSRAKTMGAYTLIDGAQLVMHARIDVKKLDCDFFVCSGHKMYGPSGIGVLYGKYALLDQIAPQRFGGEMISKVSFEQSSFAPLPFRLEAGTPNIAGVIGLGAALRFMQKIDWLAARAHEDKLIKKVQSALKLIKQVVIIGKHGHTGILSFTLGNINHQDLATLLDKQGVALRVGQHCAMPLMQALNLSGVVRVSVALYNNEQDIERFVYALTHAINQLTTVELPTSEVGHTEQGSDLNELKQLFSSCRSWDEKYRQIMLLGKKQKPFPGQERNAEAEISACESQVWLYHKIEHTADNLQPDLHYFSIDSDARIIKGLAGLLLAGVNGKTAKEINQFDHIHLLTDLGLISQLSPSRGNGLTAIMNKIKALAKS